MIKKITLKDSVKIINQEYVVKSKKKELDDTYKYLLSRSFDYFPKVIKEDKHNYYYEYISDIDEPREQKIEDMMILTGILHSKTTFYKEIDLEHYKYIYEEINKEIDDVFNYYNNIMEYIDNEIYMSPANYLIARNISIIYEMLNYSHEYINKWYKLIDNKRDARVVTLHNNLKLEHYLKRDKPYLISWDKSKVDLPVFDMINLYKNHYLEFDFNNLLGVYFKKYPYTEEEMYLFLAIIAIPLKIINDNSEYKRVMNVRLVIDYLYKTKGILEKYGIKQETDKSNKLNK